MFFFFFYNEVSQVQPVRLLEFDQQFLANLRYAVSFFCWLLYNIHIEIYKENMCIYIYVYLYTYLKQQTVNIRIKTTHQHSVSLCFSFLLTRCYRRDRDVPPSGKRWCSRSPYRSRRGQLGSWCVTLWLFNITMGKSPCLMGKFTISMVIFHSYVKLPEGNPKKGDLSTQIGIM